MPQTKVPLVSLGMPLFNASETVRAAIESLLNQTFTDFELVISDNCSTDGTYEICQEYQAKDDRITLLRNESNLGSIKNFNIVCRESRGKYFQWTAGDDVWYPDYLAVLVRTFEENPRSVMVMALMDRQYADGAILPTVYYHGWDNPARLPRFLVATRSLSTRTNIRDKKYNLLIYGLMKRALLLTLLEKLPFHLGERHFVAHYAMCGKVIAVNQVLMRKRQHRKSANERYGASRLDQISHERCRLRRLRESISMMLKSNAIPLYSKVIHVPLFIITMLTERKIRKMIKQRLRGQEPEV